jgi:hypothetical protein
MPNRDHDDSQPTRSSDRLPSRDEPSRDEPSQRDPEDRGERAGSRQSYAPEWRSYAQDWSDHGRVQSNLEPPEDWGSDDRAENPFHAQERTRQEWNRALGTGGYARESYGPSFSASPGDAHAEPEGWGQHLRHAGMQMVSRVTRAFRGPRGYRRSDERICHEINEGLAQQFDFDPSDLEVTVTGAEVTLRGTVRSRPEKFIAEEIATEASGVREVHNQIRVRRLDLRSTSPGSSDSTNRTTLVEGRSHRDIPRA